MAKFYSESYQIAIELCDLQGIIYVDSEFGSFLCRTGENETGLVILDYARQGAQKMGLLEKTAEINALIAEFSEKE